MSPARRAALLRLLEDWEAGRMTETDFLAGLDHEFWMDGLVADGLHGLRCLTPAGLAAARQAKEQSHE